ncbi:MAG: DNA topoisomerase I [Nanoarchaeota archaeon]
MAVESFLQPDDAKITVEKEVREKPTIAELTTIESPGRPISADRLDENIAEKKKKPRKKQYPKAPVSKGNALLIITEKPQAALKIASALGNARKYAENNVPYYELTRDGKEIIVASAVGHLFNLTYSKGQVGWPIYGMEWTPAYEKAAYMKNYYTLLTKLRNRASEFMVATDYDNEGEVIGWNVLRFIMREESAKRMKFSTLTKHELEQAYDNPLLELDWAQAYAGETRHQIDWLYGINLSRALMSALKKSGTFRILSIGRVQGPALKIIVDREREISAFKSEPYWNVYALHKDQKFKHVKEIFNESELEDFKDIKEAQADTKIRQESLEPPVPFDLTTLQREAFAWLHLSPSATLKLAQSLYLDGLISYPRTSSQKIPASINAKEILKKLSHVYNQTEYTSRSNPIEGEKSDPAHPSIYPTGDYGDLKEDEKKLYELIVKRFIACFCENAELDRKTITLTAKDKKFTASATTIKDKGWMNVYPSTTQESTLQDLSGKVKVDKIEFEEKETQPPKRYTATSLISLLEKKNLGTKTTRSIIIDILIDRGYLEGQSLKPTPLGENLIRSLEQHSPIIIDENLTRDVEEEMEALQGNKQELEKKEKEIVKKVCEIIEKISIGFKAHEQEIGDSLKEGTLELREAQKEQSIIMSCPVCKVGNLCIKFSKKSRRYFAACDKYPECKTTHSLPPNSLIKTTGKTSQDGLPILVAIRKGKRPWEFEFNINYKKENPSE